tara:strand:- start:169 stop:357 length:189 start_codon:yes stop_codon:yes gene_type:complete
MKVFTVTELKLKATQIIAQIEASGEEVIITKNGKITAAIQRISENDVELKASVKRKKRDGKI